VADDQFQATAGLLSIKNVIITSAPSSSNPALKLTGESVRKGRTRPLS
jgi:hypothetical protein